LTSVAPTWRGLSFARFPASAAHPPQTSKAMQTPSSASKSLPAMGEANWYVRKYKRIAYLLILNGPDFVILNPKSISRRQNIFCKTLNKKQI
jgi:hypothetical protein